MKKTLKNFRRKKGSLLIEYDVEYVESRDISEIKSEIESLKQQKDNIVARIATLRGYVEEIKSVEVPYPNVVRRAIGLINSKREKEDIVNRLVKSFDIDAVIADEAYTTALAISEEK